MMGRTRTSPSAPASTPTMHKIGFTGHVGLEYEINAENPVGGIKESFAYMRGVLDAMEG